MPGYYARSMASQLPLTPPDSGSGYGYSNMHFAQDPYNQHQSQTCQDNAYDYQQAYLQPAVAPAPPTYQYQQNGFQATNSLPPISSYYEPIGAPILPPLRIHDHVPFPDDYQRRLQQEQQSAAAREQQRQAAKEEKATGGVSAKLDYDMERMTDFVTDAAQSIFQHRMQSPSSFRRWIHQVLSATRLPSATILLSLHYLNDRLVRFAETVPKGENQVYRYLATALILGSKFLDDNTFINRSWSDVTAIKVSELNLLEMKWLHLIEFRLHVDPSASDNLQAWFDAWAKYNADCLAAKTQPTRLAPLDTNVHRHASVSRDRFSPYPTPYTASSRTFEGSLSSTRASQFSTPFVTADPWAPSQHVDDFYKPRQDRYPSAYELEEASRRASEDRVRQSAYQYNQTAHSHAHASYYQTANYTSAWDQSSSWNNVHRYDCNCATCLYQQHYRPYPVTSSYAAQTVMG